MKKRNLICVASVLLITSAASAQIQSAVLLDTRNNNRRTNVSDRVFLNYGAGLNLDPNNLDSVLNSLKTKGIYADEKSEIQVHQEKNIVDISCFDCIVARVESGSVVEGAPNFEKDPRTE